MIPRTSVDLDSAIPAEHKGWTPKGDDLSEDGFAYFPAKPDELGSLLGCQPGSLAGIRLFLVHPGLHSRLTQIEVFGYLADAAIALAAQLDDLSFELRGERPTRTGFLRSMVSILDILSGAVPLMVDVRQTGESPHWWKVPSERLMTAGGSLLALRGSVPITALESRYWRTRSGTSSKPTASAVSYPRLVGPRPTSCPPDRGAGEPLPRGVTDRLIA